MLLLLLFYYRLLNSPHGTISRKGYFFSKSVSAPISVPKIFPSSFLIFVIFTYFIWRWDPDSIVFIKGFFETEDSRGAELGYFSG